MITRTVAVDLRCGQCGTKASFEGTRPREVLKTARAAGWWLKGNKALCPKHKQDQSDSRRREHAPREVRP